MADRRDVQVIMQDPHTKWWETRVNGGTGPVIRGRGYALVDGKYREEQALVDAVAAKCSSAADLAGALKALIPSLDGCWALAAHWPDGRVLAATDRIRSIPMFYAETPERFVLSATHRDVRRLCRLNEVDDEAALDFLLLGYVTGEDTLFKGVKQIRCGEIIEYDPSAAGSGLNRTRYFRYFPVEYSDASQGELEDELESILVSMFKTFVDGFPGGKIVIPLSGGLDSRLIAGMLKKNGYEDVLCFSYGRAGNGQSKISKQVADALGYEWKFVEYTGEKWHKWMSSGEMKTYWAYCSKATSIPHLADFPAVMSIMPGLESSARPLFFPGHSLDMPTGSHIPPCHKELAEGVVSRVDEIVRFHSIWPRHFFEVPGCAMKKIERISAAPVGGPDSNPVASCELWNVENRQALWIVNSVRAYEFFGARWRTLWDYPLMEFFFQKLPLRYRLGRWLHAGVVQERLFTGSIAALGKIPMTGVGRWWGRDGLAEQPPIRQRSRGLPFQSREMAKKTLARLGLLDKLRNLVRPGATTGLCAETWFAQGKSPRKVTLAQAMRPYHTLEKLPPRALAIVKPWLNYRVDLVSYKQLISAIALGDACSDIPSRRNFSNAQAQRRKSSAAELPSGAAPC